MDYEGNDLLGVGGASSTGYHRRGAGAIQLHRTPDNHTDHGVDELSMVPEKAGLIFGHLFEHDAQADHLCIILRDFFVSFSLISLLNSL